MVDNIRIEIPQRIEESHLIGKITELPKEQFWRYYKSMIEIFNVNIINEMMKLEKEAIEKSKVNFQLFFFFKCCTL